MGDLIKVNSAQDVEPLTPIANLHKTALGRMSNSFHDMIQDQSDKVRSPMRQKSILTGKKGSKSHRSQRSTSHN